MPKKVIAAWGLVLGLGAAALVAWPVDVPAQDAKPDAKADAKPVAAPETEAPLTR